MAGILYLFRLFVYHAAETENVVKTRFKLMEQKLYRIITFPAMVAAFALGISMIASNPSLLQMPWMHSKIVLVVLLAGVTLYAGQCLKRFARDEVPGTEKFFRIINEIPTLLMMIIVFLVILKPF